MATPTGVFVAKIATLLSREYWSASRGYLCSATLRDDFGLELLGMDKRYDMLGRTTRISRNHGTLTDAHNEVKEKFFRAPRSIEPEERFLRSRAQLLQTTKMADELTNV